MKVVVETIDARRAHALLDTAARAGQKQRHLSEKRVEKFARAMVEGQWQLTHQGIGIDKDGVLIDGQHRLAAVIRSNTEQQFLVAYEADAQTFDVIDTGQARTAADILSIAGYANVNQISAAARILLSYDLVKGTKGNIASAGRQFTNADILNFVEGPRGDILVHAVNEATNIAGQAGRFGARSWLSAGVVLLLESGVHKDIAKEFLTKLRTGEMLAAGSPILAMRRWIMSDGGWVSNTASDRQTVGLAVFIKTLNAWLAKDRRNLAMFKPGVEFVPEIKLPEGFLTMGSYGDDERLTSEIEDTIAQELEEATARR
jgi:hypothetical protein